ncbi:hypothetical protein, partial [Nocardia wallacei]|uniref:hypothetical protein n=1 Tax=Nocardia wallacei TaxID=480035 RepID=UPI002454EBF9
MDRRPVPSRPPSGGGRTAPIVAVLAGMVVMLGVGVAVGILVGRDSGGSGGVGGGPRAPPPPPKNIKYNQRTRPTRR